MFKRALRRTAGGHRRWFRQNQEVAEAAPTKVGHRIGSRTPTRFRLRKVATQKAEPVGLGKVRSQDYSKEKIRATYRWTPNSIADPENHTPDKYEFQGPITNRRTNILVNVPDSVLLRYPDSDLAVAELQRRMVVAEFREEADAGLAEIAASGYEDLDFFDLLDANQNGTLCLRELDTLAGLLDLGTGEDLMVAIKGTTADGEVTPKEFSEWYATVSLY